MAKIVTVSTIQLPAWKEGEKPEEAKASNLKNIFEMLEIAGERNSDVVVFGEYCNMRGIDWNSQNGRKFIDTVPGPLIDLDKKRITNFHFAKNCDRTLAVMASRRPEVYGELVNQVYQEQALARSEKEYLS